MAITFSTPASSYNTGHFVSGESVIVTIRLDNASEWGRVEVWDTAYSRIYRRPVPSSWYTIRQISPTHYELSYTPYSGLTKVYIRVGDAGASYSVGPPPQPVTFEVDRTVLFHGEVVTVSFFVNLKGRTLGAGDIGLNTGELLNFRGQGNRYTVEVKAPDVGFGTIELSILGYPGVIEEVLYAPRPTEDIVFLGRKYLPPQFAREDGVVFLESIETELDTINDIDVLILFDWNMTGFTEDEIYVEAVDSNNDDVEAFVADFEGKDSVYLATIRVLSSGGAGKVVVNIGANVTDQGNPAKSLTIAYDDALVSPEWEVMFVTAETYNDIVSVSTDGLELLRGNQIDFFSFAGEIDTARQVDLPSTPVVTRAVKYDTGKYLGLATTSNSKAHLFVEGATDWDSDSVFTLATDRHSDPSNVIRGLAVNDWAWTRDRHVILASMPFQNHAAKIGVFHSLEIHQAIREGTDLNDIVFDAVSVDYGDLNVDSWNGLVAVAHDEGKLFVGSNETGSNEQNYIFVFDKNNKMVLGQQIPIKGRVKALFAKNGWLYRYNDTTKAMLRFPLSTLRRPAPKKEIYPQIVLPGDRIDGRKFVRYADRVVFDVGFKKPWWLSIEDNEIVVAPDAPVKSTAYVRLRGINTNGASLAGSFGFYIYVRERRSPEWKNFKKLSMYHNQVLNMHAYVEGADEIEWQDGAKVPPDVVLEQDKIKKQ